MDNRILIIVIIILIVAIGAILVFMNGSPVSGVNPNPTTNVTPNTQVKVNTVQVAKFYNGQYGYSLSIPSGNKSTCVWTWVDGNAAIPFSRTTYANTATEKHTIQISETATNWKVNCTDDFGNQYIGIFPSN